MCANDPVNGDVAAGICSQMRGALLWRCILFDGPDISCEVRSVAALMYAAAELCV